MGCPVVRDLCRDIIWEVGEDGMGLTGSVVSAIAREGPCAGCEPPPISWTREMGGFWRG